MQCIYEDRCNRVIEGTKSRQNTILYLWHWCIFEQLIYSIYAFLVLLPGKVSWPSVTAGNSFTSSLSSLFRVSQQLHSKFSSCFVCNSCKWKDFRYQPLKPGTSSQLTRILYTSPRSPVSTWTKYHEEEGAVKVGSLRQIFPNLSVKIVNLTVNNGNVEFEAGISMVIESMLFVSWYNHGWDYFLY